MVAGKPLLYIAEKYDSGPNRLKAIRQHRRVLRKTKTLHKMLHKMPGLLCDIRQDTKHPRHGEYEWYRCGCLERCEVHLEERQKAYLRLQVARQDESDPLHNSLEYGCCLADDCLYHGEEKRGVSVYDVRHSRHLSRQCQWRDCRGLEECKVHTALKRYEEEQVENLGREQLSGKVLVMRDSATREW